IWAADLHLTPDGKFLYASERTSSTLAAFAVDAQTGKLAYLSSVPTERQPRGFAIDPKGKFLVASGEKSETLSVYAIEASGALRPAHKAPTGKGSNWVEIVAFDRLRARSAPCARPKAPGSGRARTACSSPAARSARWPDR